MATADADATTTPDQQYPNDRDKGTGLGEAGFVKPGDEVVRSARHQAREESK